MCVIHYSDPIHWMKLQRPPSTCSYKGENNTVNILSCSLFLFSSFSLSCSARSLHTSSPYRRVRMARSSSHWSL